MNENRGWRQFDIPPPFGLSPLYTDEELRPAVNPC